MARFIVHRVTPLIRKRLPLGRYYLELYGGPRGGRFLMSEVPLYGFGFRAARGPQVRFYEAVAPTSSRGGLVLA